MAITAPLKFYTQEDDYPLLFHQIDCGQGLMTLIVFPDQTTMLFDCNLTADNRDRIIRYLKENIPVRYDFVTEEECQWIDVYVNSHRDSDHYTGLTDIVTEFGGDELGVRQIWDSGQTGATTHDEGYEYYMRLRRTLKDKYGSDAVVVPSPSPFPLATFGGATVHCLCSSKDFLSERFVKSYGAEMLFSEAIETKGAKIQHSNAIVLRISYGGRAIMLTSDSDYIAWRDKIVPNFPTDLLKADILVAAHHGSRSFFTDPVISEGIDAEKYPDITYIESLDCIDPAIVLISCAENNSYGHPDQAAMKLYKSHVPYNHQVFGTYDKGTLAGFISYDGRWTICPSRFNWSSTSNHSFQIRCTVEYNGEKRNGTSNGDFPIGSTVHFTVASQNGIIEPFPNVSVTWEVSNGGTNDYHEHQEIYFKGAQESEGKLEFARDVSFVGKHLLRCRLKNGSKKADVTRIFIVNGVEQ